MIRVDDREAQWIQIVHSVGLGKKEISERYGYKYMDVVNVLRGNAFSNATGIINRTITEEEFIVAKWLLKNGHPYRAVARYTGIDANKVRNVMGHLKYQGEI